MSDPGDPWGPTVTGGTRTSVRRWSVIVLAVAFVLFTALAVTLTSLYRVAEGNLERVDLQALAPKDDQTAPMNVLVVGSDSRDGLTREEIRRLRLGAFDGQRGDSVILVSISADRQTASVVSFPRDLKVRDLDGRTRKLTETFVGGTDHTIEVIQRNTGVPVHHFVEMSIPGFLNVVDVIGGVEICLDESLRDRKSGSDFSAGCHEMGPEEALSYVRARQTQRGDFDRMDRQQRFLKAVLDRITSSRILVDLPKLFEVVERVSRNVTTDSGFGLRDMKDLAEEMRHLAGGRVPMTVVPSYARSIGGVSYVVPYEPGARALYRALRTGEAVPSRGPRDAREETRVAVWDGGEPETTDEVTRTLFWSAFNAYGAGRSPVIVGEVAVYALPGEEVRAGWVAALLGVEAEPLPSVLEAPEGAHVVVVTPESVR